MENLDDEFEFCEPFLTGSEAEEFAKPFWRNPTEQELEELAHYIADDYVKSEKDWVDPEMDQAEMLIMLQKEMQNTLEELRSLTRALDMPGVNATIFFTFQLSFYKTEKSHVLHFEDGLVRFLKKDGVLTEIGEEDDVLFEM